MVQLESAVVNMTPSVITIVFCSLLVTARVEQIPRIWTNTGLSFPSGARKVFFNWFFAISLPPYDPRSFGRCAVCKVPEIFGCPGGSCDSIDFIGSIGSPFLN